MKYFVAASIIGLDAVLLWAGLYFGSRWIDRMLCVPPPGDPDKPIVRPVRTVG